MARGDSRFGLTAVAMLLVVLAIGGVGTWYAAGGWSDDRDPWLDADARVAVRLLQALGEEYFVLGQVERVASGWEEAERRQAGVPQPPIPPQPPGSGVDERLTQIRRRFEVALAEVRAVAGGRVRGLGLLQAANGSALIASGALEGAAALWPLAKTIEVITVFEGEKERVFLAPIMDRFGGKGRLDAVAVLVLDPAAPYAPAAHPKRDERGVLAAALLRALAEEYHLLLRIERVASGLDEAERRERAGETVPDKPEIALDWLRRKEILTQRYTHHLTEARAQADTRCLALIVERNDASDPTPLLTTPSAGRFAADERFAVERDGKSTGFGIALGTSKRRPVVETRAGVRDLWTNDGPLPWTVHVWLNADPRQAPGR